MRHEASDRVAVTRRTGPLAVIETRIASVARPLVSRPTGPAATATSAGRHSRAGWATANNGLIRELAIPDRSE